MTEDYAFYLVESGNFKDKATRDAYASSIKKKGGAGFVFENENTVAISVYREKNDAESVAKKLIKNFDIESSVREVKIESEKLKFDTPNSIIEHNLKMIDNMNKYFDEVYSLSISLDSGSNDMQSIKRFLSEDKESLVSSLSEYEEKSLNASSSEKLITAYNKLISGINRLVSSKSSESVFKGELKHFNIEIIYLLKSMIY